MADIFEMLKEAGVEIPADKKDAFNKEFRKTYKSEGEISKVTDRLEADRDNWKQKAETAEETLKKFEGVDLETIQKDLETWKLKAETAQSEYEQKIAERDFEDILKTAISEAKGKNEKAIRANLDIDKLMKSRNQREDVKKALEELKCAEDTSFMFVDEEAEAAKKAEEEAKQKAAASAPKFTEKSTGKPPTSGSDKPTFNFGFTPIRDVKKGD